MAPHVFQPQTAVSTDCKVKATYLHSTWFYVDTAVRRDVTTITVVTSDRSIQIAFDLRKYFSQNVAERC
jgi:hypothetical protein